MALATKCPHCNTIFRVAHDQLKLRGGIVRCGACNEVFDGNAALIQPQPAPARHTPSVSTPVSPPVSASPLPPPLALDAKLEALDQHAAALHDDDLDGIHTLQLDADATDATDDAAELAHLASHAPLHQPAAPAAVPAPWEDTIAPVPEPEPAPLSAADFPPPAALSDFDLDFDLDLPPADGEDAATPVAEAAPAPAISTLAASETPVHLPAASEDEPIDLDIASMSDTELEAALQAELEAIDAAEENLRRETAAALEIEATLPPVVAAMPAPEPVLSAADMLPPALDGRREPTLGNIDDDALAEVLRDDPLTASKDSARTLNDDDEFDADEEALVQLSAAGVARAGGTQTNTHTLDALQAQDDDLALADAPRNAAAAATDEAEDDAAHEEPGFVKRDRRRQRFSKVATVVMSIGSVLLVGALGAQVLTTFRNTLAANVPALKPALSSACAALGCQIELPTQIESVTIEQGELQSLSDTTFSFTTLLRNQSASAQAWPHIELVLDDDKDKAILRRVFAPADYLAAGGAQAAPLAQGFAPHTEQSVKLYFELKQLKASGYHIAVFYP